MRHNKQGLHNFDRQPSKKYICYNRIMKNKLSLISLRNTFCAVIYIFLVSQILNNSQILFGSIDNSYIGPFVMLLLFVTSAAVVGSLVFGQAVLLFFEGKRSDSVKSAIYSVGWLFLMMSVAFICLLIANLLA